MFSYNESVVLLIQIENTNSNCNIFSEPDQYIDLADQETLVYLSDGNHIVTSGELLCVHSF